MLPRTAGRALTHLRILTDHRAPAFALKEGAFNQGESFRSLSQYSVGLYIPMLFKFHRTIWNFNLDNTQEQLLGSHILSH